MTTHKIRWLRTGTYNGMDWESEHEITFRFRPGAAPIIYPADNADPGYPDEVEFVSITPDAGDHGAFSDIAQRNLESDAQEWLETDGFDEAIQIATSDLDAAREFAADLRADR